MSADTRPGIGTTIQEATKPIDEFSIRAIEIFDDYTTTLLPVIPNLHNSITLKDSAGVDWEISTLRSEKDNSIISLMMETGRSRRMFSAYYLTKSPNSTLQSMRNYAWLVEGEKALVATREKLVELLAPIKAAQALNNHILSESSDLVHVNKNESSFSSNIDNVHVDPRTPPKDLDDLSS